MSQPTEVYLSHLQSECWRIAEEHGWHETADDVAAKLLLIHSEVSEATEDYRDDLMKIYHRDGKPCGFPIELADIIIRVLDLASILNLDITTAILMKMHYNESRPYRHGGKKI